MWKLKSLRHKLHPADTARLSPEEYQQIIEHVEQCTSCRAGHPEFLSFLEQLPTEDNARTNAELLRHIHQGGLRERFLERARAAGIELSETPVNRSPATLHLLTPAGWAVAAAVLGVFIGVLGRRAIHREPAAFVATATPTPEAKSLAAQTEIAHKLERKIAELQAAIDAAEETNSELQDENSAVRAQAGALGKDLAGQRAENDALKHSVAYLRDVNSQQSRQNENTELLLSRAQTDLEEVRARGKAMEVQIGAQQEEAAALSRQLSASSDTLARDRELLAAGRDITDLMGARNLHIIDVRDADGSGKNRKSFGRIFYTEGKSLIFYAYDLDEGKIEKANWSFEVWGEKLGEPGSVRSLGILYTDNKEQKRWALRVSDPQQLAEIDSVFVTLESHRGARHPRGGKILFAFLGGQPNHP
jgi:hypothetical protein